MQVAVHQEAVPAMAAPPRAQVLNSWKEVAQYLGRGVRTVQRWEAEMGLPAHRPKGRERSAVIAFPSELDAWLRQAPLRDATRKLSPPAGNGNGGVKPGKKAGDAGCDSLLLRHAELLREISEKLRQQQQQVAALARNREMLLAAKASRGATAPLMREAQTQLAVGEGNPASGTAQSLLRIRNITAA